MNRKWYLFLFIVLLIGFQPAFAQTTIDLELISDEDLIKELRSADDIELVNRSGEILGRDTTTYAAQNVPDNLRNNQYLLESKRLAGLAEQSYEQDDYDAAIEYALEAIRYAQLSDEYIAMQLRIAAGTPPPAAPSMAVSQDTKAPLPATYTVRPWNVSRDCFWNIAGYPWVYGNPHQWRVLYNANRSKLPDPNNPNLIEPGTVLDIPSIKGEVRQGAWDSSKTYTPLN